ncbi:MAG: Bro-N domain-containing protein [Spirochaetaceae bacterium]|jgi:prophage antirepressor-like protein|nr:Bro-N domain-containing protein [Spirochaetaceae bacterium]
MNNQLIPFSFEEKEVRVVIVDGQEWWVGRDVATALGYKNTNDAIQKHCKGVAKHYPLQTAGGTQEARIINEGGVFRLVVGSNLPQARRFEKWLFEEVLPQIRRTGGYGTRPGDFIEGYLLVKGLEEENGYLRDEVKALRSEVGRYERRGFLTAGDRLDILKLHVRKYPVSAIQMITKKGRVRIRKFLDGFFALSAEERDAEIAAWAAAASDKGGGV